MHEKSKNSDFKFSYILFSKKHFVPNNEQHESFFTFKQKIYKQNYIHAHKFGTKIKFLNSRNMIHIQINIKATCTGML